MAGADTPVVAVEQDAYGFPYPPYPTQFELMDKVYRTLEEGGVGIFESPTGTGKTLALLCPVLSWLRRRERELLTQALQPSGEEKPCEEAWAREHHLSVAKAIADARWHRRSKRREDRRVRLQKMAALTSEGARHRQKLHRTAAPTPPAPTGDAEFSLEVPPELPAIEEPPDGESLADEEVLEGKLQVVFCSRTHSQLAQVLQEIRRISLENVPEGLAVVTLGSRNTLCINDGVRFRARGNAGHLNDLCRLATERENTVGGCSLKKQAHALADACLAEPLDLEAMAQRGRAPLGGGCPYYGSRRAVREADVLLVPYASLVNAETRAKLGIRPQGNVLVFDEAHNLLEAIGDANSVTISATQARATVDALDAYAAHYARRLSPGNAVHLRQVQQFCMRLHRHLAGLKASCAQTVGAFLVSLGADNFDLTGLSSFLERTHLCRKVRGFFEAARDVSTGKPGSSGAVYGVAELLTALLGSTSSDRILSQAPTGEGEAATIRYLSLDAEARFRDLIGSARAVLFLGGTLEPRSEFAPLYAGLDTKGNSAKAETRVNHFSGRHVVPSAHIFARYVTHGPAGSLLDFRKDKRSTAAQMSELQGILTSAAACTPGGAVFFFPSFEYLGAVALSVGSRLSGRAVFVERRSAGEDGDGAMPAGEGLLRSFAAAVRRDGGAVLLAVSGAKLSEGINFKDDLCRLVAVVGLPYPNASDLALLEKMKFLDVCRARGEPGLSGRDFYTARCMKAVNQCVGRSIRHANDWAAVLLLDHRYAQANINTLVSRWLHEEAVESRFEDADKALRHFFAVRGALRPGTNPTPGAGACADAAKEALQANEHGALLNASSAAAAVAA